MAARFNGSYEIVMGHAYLTARGILDDNETVLSPTQLKAWQILLQNQTRLQQFEILEC